MLRDYPPGDLIAVGGVEGDAVVDDELWRENPKANMYLAVERSGGRGIAEHGDGGGGVFKAAHKGHWQAFNKF